MEIPIRGSSTDDSCGHLRPGLSDRIMGIVNQLGVPPAGREYMRQTLSRPSRRPRASAGNMAGVFPSSKVGVGIALEGRTTEMSRITLLEDDDGCIAYFDQPPSIKLTYKSATSGRTLSYLQTPDILSIWAGQVFLEECKTEEDLTRRSAEQPALFCRGEGGRWHCPPAAAAAAQLGFEHRIVTERDMLVNRIRNVRLLLDYRNHGQLHVRARAEKCIGQILHKQRRILIDALLHELKDEITVDDVYRSVALNRSVADLDNELLHEHDRAHLYADRTVLAAYRASDVARTQASPWMRASRGEFCVGGTLDWDGRTWRLANLGATEAVLIDGNTVHPLPRAVFDALAREGRILSAETDAGAGDPRMTQSMRMLQTASASELERAMQAYRSILPFIGRTASRVPNRVERRHLGKWRSAEAGLGNGFVGLLPHYSRCGNRTERLSEAVLGIVREQIKKHYATPKRIRKIRVYERIVAACAEKGLLAPSYKWLCTYIKRQPAHAMLKAREGRKAAYHLEERQSPSEDVPQHHSIRPWEKVYVDHTESDIELTCSKTSRNLGRPWLTTMVDDFSRDVLAHHLSFDPPSYRSVLMVLRECVHLHGRLPELIVVDGGKELQSIWFEATATFFGISLLRRPAGRPRFGSPGERSFGTIDSNFLHSLMGNTQLRKNVRQLVPEVDPSNLAIWTFGALSVAFDRYFDYYRNLEHRELLMTPKEAREQGEQKQGMRPERRIVYNQDFLITTCPTTRRGVAKVQPDGVKINYLYYNAPELRPFLGKQIPVRFEPFNMGIAYAFVKGHWVTLKSSRFYNELCNRSERELLVAREERLKGRSQVEKRRLTEGGFVKFLLELDKTEEMLLAHHRAIEERNVRAVAEEPDHEEDIPDDRSLDTVDSLGQPLSPSSAPASVARDLRLVECEVD